MPGQSLIKQMPDCRSPEINQLLTPYCFGRASESEKRSVETHLLECEICWREAQQLDAAVLVLDTDRSLLQTLSPEGVASAFGPSGKLDWIFGGHLWHALTASFFYGALYAIALLVEIAYQYDQYHRSAIIVAIASGVWIFLTSLAGLAVDWKLTSVGSNKGLFATIAVFWFSALLLFAASCLYLPTNPITQLSTLQAYTAQAAYLKTIAYFLVLKMIFLLPTFHFVLIMQREMLEGRHRPALNLLSGDKRSIRPRGVIFPKLGVLTFLLITVIAISLFLHHNLMSNLKPGPYMNLFSNLILARLILYYLLGAECLYWYHQAINELKRECLIAERLRSANQRLS